MKYRSLMLLTILATFFGQACTAPPNQSIIVSAARAPGNSCDFSDPTKYVQGGAIDLSVYGTNSSYYQVFSWQNDLTNSGVASEGTFLSTGTQNTFIANRIELSYVFVGQTNPPPGIVNISATIPAGATALTSSVGISLLTPEAVAAVYPVVRNAAVAANDPVSFTLLVTFDVAGTTVGGSAAQTNPVTYPMTLFYGISPLGGSLTCPPATVSQVTSCNVPGRDLQYCLCTGVSDAGVVGCPKILP